MTGNKEVENREMARNLLALGMWYMAEEIKSRTRVKVKKIETKNEKVKNKLLEKLGK